MRALSCVTVLSLVAVLAVACGQPPPPKKIPKAPSGSCDTPATNVSGDVEGALCGNVTAKGVLTVAAGKTLTLGAGTVLAIPPGGSLIVQGDLEIQGTKDQPVVITSTSDWGGLQVSGTLNATFAQISGRGASMVILGGTVSLTDSSLDLENPGNSPDCIPVESGTLTLDHSKVSGCHCPFHVDGATQVTATHSILDGAVPMMITHANAEIHSSHLLATEFDLEDIGGAFTANVSGNYYGGGAPTTFGTFAGTDQFSTTPLPDVGPR